MKKKSRKKSYLKLKIAYQIAFLFDMYIYMGKRITEKQDKPSLIIEDPLRAPEKLVFKLFPLVVHTGMSPL